MGEGTVTYQDTDRSPQSDNDSPAQPLLDYGSGEVPRFLRLWAETARKLPVDEVPDLDAIARALGLPEISAKDVPGVQERKHGFEVWHGKDEQGKRRLVGTFKTLSEAIRAKERAQGVGWDATILGDSKGANE